MSNDMAGTKLLNALAKLSERNDADTMFYGTVKTLSPLSIEIYQGIVIDEKMLFLGQMCRPHKVTIPHTHEYNGITEYSSASGVATDLTLIHKGDLSFSGEGYLSETYGHPHDIKDQVTEDVHKEGSDFEEYVILEIEPKLKVGDRVLMFAFNNYQKFYVAERIEE